MRRCSRCGRKILNPSELCWKCNEEFQSYMNIHPLSNEAYESASERMMRREAEKRFRDFIEDNPSRRK